MTTKTRLHDPSSEENRSPSHAAEMLSALVAATNILLTERDLDQALHFAVIALGEKLGFDRIYLMLRDSRARSWSLVEEWAASQIVRWMSLDVGFNLRDDDFPEVVGALMRGDVYSSVHSERAGKNADVNEQIDSMSDVIVPIFVKNEIWGCIGFDDCHRERRWNPSEIDVLKGAATAIAGAIERAESERSFADLREQESLNRAAEVKKTNEAMRSTLAAMTNEPATDYFLGRVLAELSKQLESPGADLWIYKPESDRIDFYLGFVDGEPTANPLPVGSHAFKKSYPFSAVETAQILRGGYRFEANFLEIVAGLDAGALRWYAAKGVKGVLRVPIAIGNNVIGNIAIWKRDVSPFPESHVQLASSLAQQAALSIHVARLSEKAQHSAVIRERNLAAEQRAAELANANEVIRLSLARLTEGGDSLDDFLDHVLAEITRVAAADNGVVMLVSPDKSHLAMKAVILDGSVIEFSADPRFRFWSSPAPLTEFRGWTVLERNEITVDQLPEFPGALWPPSVPWHLEMGHRTVVCSPIRVGNRLVGLFGLGYKTPTVVSNQRLELIRALSNHAALATHLTTLSVENEAAAVIREREAATERAAAERQRLEREVQEKLVREREQAAKDRVTELIKVNEMLRRSADQIARAGKLADVPIVFLRNAVQMSDASAGAILRRTGDTEFTFSAILQGDLLLIGDELAAHPLTDEVQKSSRTDTSGYFARIAAGETMCRRATEQRPPGLAKIEQWHKENAQRALWDVPFKSGDRVIGYLGLAFQHGEGPSEVVRESITALANQVGVALELTRLAEEAKQAAVAREQERAAMTRAEELSAANTALRRVNQSLEVSNRLLGVVAETSTRFARSRNFSGALQSALSAVGEAAGLDRVLLLQEREREDGSQHTDHHVVGEWCSPGIANHADLGLDVMPTDAAESFVSLLRSGHAFWYRINDLDESMKALLRPLKIRATGCAPVYLNNSYWGTIAFDNCQHDSPWDEAIVDALTAAANAISAALQSEFDGDRLAAVAREREKAAQERAEELSAANEKITSSFRELSAHSGGAAAHSIFLAGIAKAASAELCYWLDYDADTDQFSVSLRCRNGLISSEPEPGEPDLFRRPFAASLMGALLDPSSGSDITLLSVERDSDRLWPETAEWHRRAGRKQVVCFPLFVGERLMGMLGMAFRHEVDWSPSRKELIRALANHLSLSVHLEKLSVQASRGAALEERARLAREIHDTLGQSFSGILVQLRALQQSGSNGDVDRNVHFENALELANSGLAEVRRSLVALRPKELDGRPFREALNLMARTAEKRSGIRVNVSTEPHIEIAAEHEPELLRIAQESVTNAIKHSGASLITILLRHHEAKVELCIADDGRGFDPIKPTDGFGLVGMQERATRIGAILKIDSDPKGTLVCVGFKGSRDS